MSNEFTNKAVSEAEKEEIRKQAKEIMEKFSDKLSKIKLNISEPVVERKEFDRGEGQGNEPNEEFRKRLFANAPNKSGDSIVMEKKKW